MTGLEAIAAPTRDAPMHRLEAIAAPTHDAPTLSLHDNTIFEGATRLRRPTTAPRRIALKLTLLPPRDTPKTEDEARPHHPTLEANTTPTHDAPTLPLRGSDDFNSETRPRRPALYIQTPEPSAETGTAAVEYVELYAGIGALSRNAQKHGGKIAMLIEKDPVAQGNLHRRFPNTEIFYDADDDSKWRTFERKSGAALGLFVSPPCQPFAPARKRLMDDDPRARYLLESAGDAVSKLLPDTIDIEAVCSAAEAKGGAILRKLDDSINRHGYTRVTPEGTTTPERISTSHLGSAIDRT